jgi:hypothetical protein
MKRIAVHALSLAAAGMPFAFASIRAIQTGWDFRYFLIATAGLLGAATTVLIGRGYTTGWGSFAMAMAALVASGFLSVLAAMTIGTRLGLGLLVVAASFAVCFAAAVLFHLIVPER